MILPCLLMNGVQGLRRQMIQLFTSHQTWEMLCSAVPLMVGGSGEASQITRFHCFYFDKVLGKKAKKTKYVSLCIWQVQCTALIHEWTKNKNKKIVEFQPGLKMKGFWTIMIWSNTVSSITSLMFVRSR